MNVHKKLRQLERRVAALEKRQAPYEVQLDISPEAIDWRTVNQILGRQSNPPETDDTPQGTP